MAHRAAVERRPLPTRERHQRLQPQSCDSSFTPVQQEAGVLLWHHALTPGAGKLAALVAASAAGACLGVLEAPGAAAPERCCALGILAGVARAGEAGRADVAAARTRKVGPDCHPAAPPGGQVPGLGCQRTLS